jgi:hypothetical protein
LKNKSPAEILRHFVKKGLCFFEINPWSRFADFTLKPLYFSKINPRSMILQLGPKLKKTFSKGSLASEKSPKIVPKLQKFISFQPQLQIQ